MVKNLIQIKNYLWTYRKKMGLSQKRAALILGMRRTNDLSRYEHGRRLPSLTGALKLEIGYRTPVAFLFQDLYGQLKKKIKKREERLKTHEEE
jgi:transcriptional regulator with XRE-family HTH domain